MNLSKNKIPLFYIVQWLLYSILFIVFYNKYLYSFGPDFVSYHAIAKQLHNGDIYDAINAWWSPLYSWLLAVIYTFIKDPLLANKIVQYVIGWGIFILFKKMVQIFVPNAKPIFLESITSAGLFFIVVWVLKSDTPDLLSAFLLLLFLKLLLQLQQNYNATAAILAGCVGGLAVYAKAYNFYFLLSFALLTLVFYLVKLKNTFPVWKRFFLVAIPFTTLAALLALLIYSKTGKLQISGIAQHEVGTIDFIKENQEPVQPYDWVGLGLHPKSLYSNWETPSLYPAKPIANTLTNNYSKTLQQFSKNASHAFRYYFSIYAIGLLVVLIQINFSWARKSFFLWSTYFALYCAGYFLLHIEIRFFIMPILLIMILVASAALQVIQKFTDDKWKVLLTILVVMLFAKTPLTQLLQEKENDLPKKIHDFAFRNKIIPNFQRIAATKGQFEAALYYCFYTGNQCIGSLNQEVNTVAAVNALKNNNATYILTKDTAANYKLIPFP